MLVHAAGIVESPVMTLIILSVLIGSVAGLRAMTAPAAVAVGARYGAIAVAGTPLVTLTQAPGAIVRNSRAFPGRHVFLSTAGGER